MARLVAGDIASATGGALALGARSAAASGVSIDSRSVAAGELFFAIRGPRNDGHAFVPDVWARGAAGAVVADDYAVPAEAPAGFFVVRVKDTHEALKALARAVRLQWRGRLVAVTGSMGKTTTREFACQLLENRFPAYQTPGNYNNLFGLPLSLLGLEPGHEVGVFEMGMSAPGEIAEMCRVALPDIGVLTGVAPVHLEFFASVEEIAEAKGELVSGLAPGGTLIYNADDPLVCKLARRFGGEKVSFGSSPDADVRADQVEMRDLGTTCFRLSYEGRRVRAALPFTGAHFVQNALPGAALGLKFGMSPAQVADAMAKLRQPAMRGEVSRFQKGAGGFAVIDDSYNSNPCALRGMIDALCAVPGFSRRVLVAGEMLELGADAPRMHFECGEYASRSGVGLVVGVQGGAVELVRAASKGCADGARFFGSSDEAAEFVAANVREGDLVLVKGSRGAHTEKVVEALAARFGKEPQRGWR
ncbi:MAG: UDP-N-acetylmuramoyl-tripeptide--D-alanyl-D-alanine ligase [Acidobacteriota bacterium]|nr:UDP-N-acetylmuramoyl-tripeptide--D-alanyl-D-alanine ligase [Acidobacteriota bacterium]